MLVIISSVSLACCWLSLKYLKASRKPIFLATFNPSIVLRARNSSVSISVLFLSKPERKYRRKLSENLRASGKIKKVQYKFHFGNHGLLYNRRVFITLVIASSRLDSLN